MTAGRPVVKDNIHNRQARGEMLRGVDESNSLPCTLRLVPHTFYFSVLTHIEKPIRLAVQEGFVWKNLSGESFEGIALK